MAVLVQCPNPSCGKVGRVPGSALSQTVRCPLCHHTFVAAPATLRTNAADSTNPAAARSAAPADHPARIGRFEVRARLGAGAFGVVYRAHDPELDREVALKVPHPGALDTPDAVARFLGEARAAAGLCHPHIVPVYQAGEDGPHAYLASAFVPGRTLAQALEAGPVEPARAVEWVRQLAEALAYAHAQGVAHRDVKPANVLLDEQDRAHLTDFGLAYVAPEQAAGSTDEVLPAGDQYALGALLYELLCSRPPFAGPRTAVLDNVQHTEPARPRSLNPRLSPDLETVCLKALARDPARRYASCQELADDLRRWQEGEPVRARRPGLGERAARWARRRPQLAGALAVAAVGLIVLTAVETVVGYGSASLARSENEARERAEQLRQEEDEAHRRADEARAEAEQACREIEEKRRQMVEARDRAGRPGQDARAEQEQRVTSGVKDQAEKDRQAGEAVGRQVEDRRLKEKLAALEQQQHRIADHWHRANYAAAAVAYSRDGTRLAGVGADRAAHVWDATNGKQLLALPAEREAPPDHSGAVAVALSPDGGRLATAGWHDGLTLWDATTGKELRTLEGHVEKVWSVAFSPDGKTLASAGQDGVVFLWDVATGRRTQALAGHDEAVTHVAFSPDGQRLASGSFDKAVKLWNVTTGQEIQTLGGHTDTVADVAFSPDGKRLASAGADRTVRVWDLATGKQVYFRGHAAPFSGVAYSPDGKRLAAATADRAVLVVDADKGQTLLTFEAPGEAGAGLAGLAFRPDGRQLALADGVFDRRGWPSPGGVEVWDGGAGRQTCTVRLATGKAALVAFAGAELVGATDQEVRVWDPATGQAVRTLANLSGVLAVAPDGGNAAGVSRDGIWLVDLKSGARSALSKWKAGDNLGQYWSLAFSADGRRLAFGVGGLTGGVVKLWDVPRGRELPELTWQVLKGAAVLRVGGAVAASAKTLPVFAVALGPDGVYLAESTSAGVRLWYAERQQDRGTFASPGGNTPVLHLAFSGDGKQLALGTINGLWLKELGADPLTRLTRKGLIDPARSVGSDGVQKRTGSGLAFSPDSLLLAAVTHDGEVAVWRTATHKDFLTVATGQAVGTAFGPDGRLLAVLQQNGTIVVWNLPGTRPLLSLK